VYKMIFLNSGFNTSALGTRHWHCWFDGRTFYRKKYTGQEL